jgi:hypothetical protein
VSNAEEFVANLEREPGHTPATAPTERELQQDAQSFMAFASAVGVKAGV